MEYYYRDEQMVGRYQYSSTPSFSKWRFRNVNLGNGLENAWNCLRFERILAPPIAIWWGTSDHFMLRSLLGEQQIGLSQPEA
jgi:hypothetical protein